MVAAPRSYLFVPGDRPDRFAKAAASGAHAIILDLEDAVAPPNKAAAREAVAAWFAGGGSAVVRINGTESPFAGEDMAMLAGSGAGPIMVPKAGPAALAEVAAAVPGRELIALVETVAGLVDVHAVAASAGVSRLAFGNLDFAADARIPCTGDTLNPARFDLAIASRHADLAPPIDGVTPEIGDEARLASDVARAARLGFGAKLCIHPRQVEAVNLGLAPQPAEIDWARRVLEAVAADAGAGVVVLDGKMVDAPVVARAKAILEAAAV